jgi:hypothetical protein
MTGSHDEPTARPGTPGTQPPSPRPLNVARLWAGGVATAVVATLIALVGVLVVRVVLRIAGYTLSGAGGFGGSATVAVCVAAAAGAAGAFVATGLAHVLIITTPRPLTYLSWIVGLATAVAVVVPLVTEASLVLALGQAVVHFAVGMTIGTLVITAVRASRPPYPFRRVEFR